jgi:hypothetical protein
VQLVYTIRASYALLVLACLIGAPWVWRGWMSLAPSVRWSALAVFLTYVVSAIFGTNEVLVGQARAGEYRFAVYLLDLALGLAVIGLVSGLWPAGRTPWLMLIALVIGATLAALYAVYQWPAQHFRWPLDDLNNTRDTNGITAGASQGNGLLGWERVRGTFSEPHFLSAYLTSLLPLCGALLLRNRGWSWGLSAAALSFIGLAIIFTGSASSYVVLLVCTLAGVAMFAVANGRVRLARIAGALLVCCVVLGASMLTASNRIAPLTGRSESELRYTTKFRTETWQRAIETWTRRPIVGYGPGQSSVRLVLPNETESGDTTAPKPVLRSAQGLWAASLIDAGVIGFAMWIVFLTAVLIAAVRAFVSNPSTYKFSLCLASMVGIAQSQIAGDRMDLGVWVLIGLLLATTSSEASESHTTCRAGEPEGGSG